MGEGRSVSKRPPVGRPGAEEAKKERSCRGSEREKKEAAELASRARDRYIEYTG